LKMAPQPIANGLGTRGAGPRAELDTQQDQTASSMGDRDSMLVSFAHRHSAHDRHEVERRLAQALSGLGAAAETAPATVIDHHVSSRELLQRAWDRAEEEIEALQTELRLLRQRHQEAERQLLARIHERKRLQQTILDSASETATAA